MASLSVFFLFANFAKKKNVGGEAPLVEWEGSGFLLISELGFGGFLGSVGSWARWVPGLGRFLGSVGTWVRWVPGLGGFLG
jgi:hypothetical protein